MMVVEGRGRVADLPSLIDGSSFIIVLFS